MRRPRRAAHRRGVDQAAQLPRSGRLRSMRNDARSVPASPLRLRTRASSGSRASPMDVKYVGCFRSPGPEPCVLGWLAFRGQRARSAQEVRVSDPAGEPTQGRRQHRRPRNPLHPRRRRLAPALRPRRRHHRCYGEDRDATGAGRGRRCPRQRPDPEPPSTTTTDQLDDAAVVVGPASRTPSCASCRHFHRLREEHEVFTLHPVLLPITTIQSGKKQSKSALFPAEKASKHRHQHHSPSGLVVVENLNINNNPNPTPHPIRNIPIGNSPDDRRRLSDSAIDIAIVMLHLPLSSRPPSSMHEGARRASTATSAAPSLPTGSRQRHAATTQTSVARFDDATNNKSAQPSRELELSWMMACRSRITSTWISGDADQPKAMDIAMELTTIPPPSTRSAAPIKCRTSTSARKWRCRRDAARRGMSGFSDGSS